MSLQHSKLVTSKTGSMPLKLPKALVLSQFEVDTLPIVVPVDVLVDGQPAGMSRYSCVGLLRANTWDVDHGILQLVK